MTSGEPTRSATQWPDALAALAILGGIAAAFGGLVSERVIWATSARSVRDRTEAAPVPAGLSVAMTGLVSALALSLKRSGAFAHIGRWAEALDGRFDQFTLRALALTAVAAILVRRERVRPYALAPAAAAIWLLVARGHPSDAGQWWAVPTTALHVIIAGTWFGALVHLHRTARAATDSHAIERGPRRYARLAAVLAVTAIGLGALAALAQFDRPAQLLTTAYGRVLIIKIALLVGVLAIAATARRRALPSDGVRIRRLARYTRVELCGLAAVFAASAVLASTSPPTPAAGFILGPAPLADPTVWVADLAGNHMVLAAATTDRLQVRIYPPGGQPDAQLTISLTGHNPDSSDFDLYPRTCGYGCKEINHTWPDGLSTITVTVQSDDYEGGTTTLSVPWPPGSDAHDLLARAIAATRAAPQMRVTETVNSGPNATSGPYQLTTTGPAFIASLPYANGADDVRQLTDNDGLTVIAFTVSGSNTWHQLWIGNDDRIRRQVLIDPGHRVEHDIKYPA
ncbi:MAG TPA: CopD family protein [Acidimicrobiales bacterium]|nr:CopD family protein [Acidimicrobiales bacterium]